MVKYEEKLEMQGIFIDGEWTTSSGGDIYTITNPSTGKPSVECQKCDIEDTKRAIDAARNAFDNGPWSKMLLKERAEVLYKVSDMIAEEAWRIGKLDAICNGVPILHHVATIAEFSPYFRYVCKWAKKVMEPEKIHGEFPLETTVWREPDGVVALITPWNVPFWQMALKLPAALIGGNTVVLKPASQTPLSALAVTKMFEKAGLPKGVLNTITGPGPVVGAEMAKSDKVDHIALTGETTTGKEIIRNASKSLKKVTLELGGKSPNIIFDDFPVEEAARMAVYGLSIANGEICIAGTRVLVQETIHKEVAKKTAEIYGLLRVGNALSLTTEIGPLVTERQMKKVLGYIDSGKEEGATLLCGGKRLQNGELKDGFFVAPTVFDDVSNDMNIAREEIFGPVISIIPFSTEEDAIKIANDTIYGLAGGVMSRDKEKAIRVAKKIRAGNIFVNTWYAIPWYMPFGGYKQSGWGRLSGESGIKAFTQVKSVLADWGGFTEGILKTLLPSSEQVGNSDEVERLVNLLTNDLLLKIMDKGVKNPVLMNITGTLYKTLPVQSIFKLIAPAMEGRLSPKESRELLEKLDLPENDEVAEKLLRNVILALSNLVS